MTNIVHELSTKSNLKKYVIKIIFPTCKNQYLNFVCYMDGKMRGWMAGWQDGCMHD